MVVRVVASPVAVAGPEHGEAEPAEREPAPRPSDADRNPAPARLGQRRPAERIFERQRWMEDELHAQPADYLLGAADVVSRGMGEYEHRQPAHAEAEQLVGYVRLRRALVDQHRPLG